MGRRRKKTRPNLRDDPHGWLVEVLRGGEQHSVKAQRAVTALSAFDYIAGSDQGARTSRPFDHQAADDSIRTDTKTQQFGVLHVKQEKPGKQFTAWVTAGKRFVPVQLALDSLTCSWYVVRASRGSRSGWTHLRRPSTRPTRWRPSRSRTDRSMIFW